jgi:drug/metabolite transporter (DMT)-like permease
MLSATIVLWALNLSVTRYILTHGFQPLSYTSTRYGAAALSFAAIALATERTLRIARPHLALVTGAALALSLNQVAFVYAVKTTSASLVALILAAVPIFAALIGLALRTEQLGRRFWIGAAISFAGVGLVVLGTGADVRHDRLGVVYGIVTAGTWAVYSVVITPLMRI